MNGTVRMQSCLSLALLLLRTRQTSETLVSAVSKSEVAPVLLRTLGMGAVHDKTLAGAVFLQLGARNLSIPCVARRKKRLLSERKSCARIHVNESLVFRQSDHSWK